MTQPLPGHAFPRRRPGSGRFLPLARAPQRPQKIIPQNLKKPLHLPAVFAIIINGLACARYRMLV